MRRRFVLLTTLASFLCAFRLCVFGHRAPALESVKRTHDEERAARARWARSNLTIAVVLCATSRGVVDTRWQSLALTSIMLPSLAATVERGYGYSLYIGVDDDDVFFTKADTTSYVKSVVGDAMRVVVESYRRTGRRVPFNQILERAFEDGNDYLVRINDDTQFLTKSWTSLAIDELMRNTPPNVGVVGPVVHGPRNVNARILTHDVVHRTHMEIFRCDYYPKVFENVWIDDWITRVYAQRARSLSNWRVHHHTGHHGTRYGVDKSLKRMLQAEIGSGTIQIERWVRHHEARRSTRTTSCADVRAKTPIESAT